MLREFLNLQALDRFHKIGRYAQAIGLLLIVAPLFGAVVNGLTPKREPNALLGPLPDFSPTAVAFRHPVLVAACSAPLGLVVLFVGTRFLLRQPWAVKALRRICWVGVCLLLLQAAFFATTAFTVRVPIQAGFSVINVVLCFGFSVMLYGVIRQLASPEILGEFTEQARS